MLLESFVYVFFKKKNSPRFIVDLIDVAELYRNVTKRERSQHNVAGPEET